jgi:hypothetical protein
MTSVIIPNDTDNDSEKELVEEHYELLERIADTGLPVADRCARLLEQYEAGDLDA